LILVPCSFNSTLIPVQVPYIPMSIMKYSPINTYISLYTGKFVLTLFALYTARKSEEVINSALGGGIVGSAPSIAIIIGLSYLMMRVDWERVLAQTQQRGFLRRLLRSGWSRLTGKGAKASP